MEISHMLCEFSKRMTEHMKCICKNYLNKILASTFQPKIQFPFPIHFDMKDEVEN